MPKDHLEKELCAIVGFRIRVTSIEAAFKLSQNRNPADYERIIVELQKRPDEHSKDIAKSMERVRNRPVR